MCVHVCLCVYVEASNLPSLHCRPLFSPVQFPMVTLSFPSQSQGATIQMAELESQAPPLAGNVSPVRPVFSCKASCYFLQHSSHPLCFGLLQQSHVWKMRWQRATACGPQSHSRDVKSRGPGVWGFRQGLCVLMAMKPLSLLFLINNGFRSTEALPSLHYPLLPLLFPSLGGFPTQSPQPYTPA